RDRQNHSVMVFARLAPHVSLAQAQGELDGITRQLAAEHPDTNTGWGARAAPLYPSREVRDVRPALIVLLVASGFVLLIACANAANLLLGRAIARRREFLRLSASSSARAGAGRALVCAELTLSIVLLVAASLLVKSFWRLQEVSPGFHADHLLTLQVWLSKTKYPTPAQIRGFYDRLLRQIERVPGVRAAGAVSFRPFLGMAMTTPIDVEGRAPASDDQAFVGYDVVTPGYLRLIGQPLLRGRDLADSDTEDAPGASVVNEATARQYWPHQDQIG